MSIHREFVSANRLFQEFSKLGGFENVSKPEIPQLQAIVLDVAEKTGPHLDWIQNTFPQYTKHDLQHLLNIADHIHGFLPRRKVSRKSVVQINAVELTYLWLAILLHDIGMFVSSKEEKQEIRDSPEYLDFLAHHRPREEAAQEAAGRGHTVLAETIREALFAEFIRRRHAERVHTYLQRHFPDNSGNGRLRFRDTDLVRDVGILCESHNWGVRLSRDSRQPQQCVEQLNKRDLIGKTPVNHAYLACCLRLGDILDFDRSRTPLSAFHAIHFSEPLSVEEWNKHLSIKGVEVTEHRVEYVAECETPADYVAVQHFLNWVDKELQDCSRLVREFPHATAERYRLNLAPAVDRSQIRMRDPRYVAGGFRFQLEYEQIMRLLMDKSLYPDETLFLRELLQNSLDACRYQQARARHAHMGEKYIPRIQVCDYSTATRNPAEPEHGPRIVFQDNGVGMSLEQVENFFMRVGKSYYRSAEFLAERERLEQEGIHLDACSQFGIGFLSCFLGGDRIDVETFQHGSEPLKIRIEGPQKYFVIERLSKPANAGIPFNSPANAADDGPPRHAGTRITVHLREGWHKSGEAADFDVAYRTLDTVAVNQEFPITIRTWPDNSHREISTRRWDSIAPAFPDFQFGRVASDVSWLTSSTFHLSEFDGALRGQGAIWFLADEGAQCSQGRPAMHSQLYRRGHIYRNAERFFPCIGWCIWRPASKSHGKLEPHTSDDWYERRDEIQALLSGDRTDLREFWQDAGITGHSFDTRFGREYRFALFGIESPGGFQTWNAAQGSATRHDDWLPGGVSIYIDSYGSLAPAPAASRLFVPFERSGKVRAAVTWAGLQHSQRLWKSHLGSEDWINWYASFLESWDMDALNPEHRGELGKMLLELLAASPSLLLTPDFIHFVAGTHSKFGRLVFREDVEIYYSSRDATEPIPRAHIEEAAAAAKILAGDIDKTVESLSEYLGWDITQGRPA